LRESSQHAAQMRLPSPEAHKNVPAADRQADRVQAALEVIRQLALRADRTGSGRLRPWRPRRSPAPRGSRDAAGHIG
jgi:hypothetical protein